VIEPLTGSLFLSGVMLKCPYYIRPLRS